MDKRGFEMNWDKILSERNIIYFMSTLLGITTIIDIWTALSMPIFYIAETNPIFLTFGIWPLTLINTGFMIYIIRGLKTSIKIHMLYMFVMACLFLSWGHIIGWHSNVETNKAYNENPQYVTDLVINTTKEEKIISYYWIVGALILIPYGISVLGFFCFYQLYNLRRTKREKYVQDICKLADKIKES